jgi:hypothetical protein
MIIQDYDGTPLIAHCVPFKRISLATNNATLIKAGASRLTSVVALSVGADARFLKIYDKDTAPDPASDTPVMTLIIPANAAGAGLVVNFSKPVKFTNGLGMAIVAGIGDTNNVAITADELVVNIGYQ